MAAGEGILASGMVLEYSADGTTWTELEDLDMMSEPDPGTPPDIDVTPVTGHGGRRKWRVGIEPGGDFMFSQFFKASRWTSLQTVKTATATADYHWRTTAPDTLGANGSRWKWTGQLKMLKPPGAGDPDEAMLIQCSVKVNSAFTFTAAA